MGLSVMILGLVLFFGIHVVSTRRTLRTQPIARFGESLYKLGYALVAAVGLALIIWGFASYRATGWIDVWTPPKAMRHIAVGLMLPAVIMVAAAYLRGRIYTTLKHPMLAGVKLWALAHLLANGDLGSIILFGSFLAWAVFDRISLKRRTDGGGPRIPVGGPLNDVLAVAVGIVAYLALGFAFHPVVIGVPVFGA
ncbi:NnrU family protein [Rhodopseudomonas sp. RCAM05734]|uniref:NnrU family protein n=1 Tax=Rhodopseudomonas sp. RCAM05734 TaxID=3457549 RepID=UPI0040445A02